MYFPSYHRFTDLSKVAVRKRSRTISSVFTQQPGTYIVSKRYQLCPSNEAMFGF